ncbi:MAG: hypothetical protein PHI87_03235 [Candidatus Methanomethylophilus sp.]|nr:hypothetical protein [Methanomethylophilus sp.]
MTAFCALIFIGGGAAYGTVAGMTGAVVGTLIGLLLTAGIVYFAHQRWQEIEEGLDDATDDY